LHSLGVEERPSQAKGRIEWATSILGFYGIGKFAGSFGLTFPEEWVKRRFAPDSLHDAESPEGWRPSKPE